MMNATARTLLILGICTMPGVVLAGGYGTAGVKDASVGQSSTAEATVWCPKLEADIPLRLQEQMDCGQAPVAAAPRERRGFFASFRHVPQGGNRDTGGSDGPNDQPSPRVAEGPNDGPRPQVSEGPRTQESASIGKWDRLSQMNVTPQNIGSQSPQFQQQFNDYFNTHGAAGDWTNFKPN